MKSPGALKELIDALRCLPGVGPKSAQRMAYHLLERDREGASTLSGALQNALSKIKHCTGCNTFTEKETCALCVSPQRDRALLCVVESPADQLTIEQTQSYKGLYYVLMGHLSPLDGVGPEELGLDRFIRRISDEGMEEVVIATNFTVEGEATAHYLTDLVRTRGLRVSRIARGLPVGGELEYTDAGTLAQALIERRRIAG